MDAVVAPYFERPDMRLYHGDAAEVMRGMEAESVDAVVCDPPYGLKFMGKEWDAPGAFVERKPNREVRFDRIGGNHNPTCSQDAARTAAAENRRAQAWHEAWAREALRVLKPGGHLVAFGGSRTYHRLACAIEDAGFEIRDQLQWLYGSGFPKSLDVSKALDRAAGAEREVTGRKSDPRYAYAANGNSGAPFGNIDPRVNAPATYAAAGNVTAPATPQAAQWEGWGTALKPAHEPICLARKRLAVPTVAANVLAHGTGAINVDACRLDSGATQTNGWKCGGETIYGNGNGLPAPGYRGGMNGGRWPANVCLSHSPECEQVGTRRVKGAGWRDDDRALKSRGGILNVTDETREDGGRHYTDADGTEEIEEWRCVPGCAVRMLDEQAGTRRSSGIFLPTDHAPNGGGWATDFHGRGVPSSMYADTGGASRFFFTAKASRSERTKTNIHPTVKPVALMRWLCRLVTPPGGIALDPFLGSGTTALAARAEGFRFIGIEREEEYLQIAVRRLAQEVLTLEDSAA